MELGRWTGQGPVDVIRYANESLSAIVSESGMSEHEEKYLMGDLLAR